MIKELFVKYKSLILYGFFGVCTTVVNVIVYWICSHLLKLDVLTSSVISWFAAVLFAYLTNRKMVFNSSASTAKDIIKEIFSFYIMRLATGVVDWLGMYIFVDLLCFNDMLIKILMNIIVIVLNYVASKLVIFRKKDTAKLD